jgi:hypothetical protein
LNYSTENAQLQATQHSIVGRNLTGEASSANNKTTKTNKHETTSRTSWAQGSGAGIISFPNVQVACGSPRPQH